MAIENLNSSQQQMLGAMFWGTVISFMLHGVTSGQMMWFFRTQFDRSGKGTIALVVFVWLSEALNCIVMLVATLNMFLLPAINYAAKHISPCTDWVARAQTIPSAMCTFTVEGFFIFRVWLLTEHKKLAMILFIPYLASSGFGVSQIVRSFQLRCDPNALDLDRVLVYSAFCSRVVGDGVVVGTMCYMLYKRSSGFTGRTNTIRIVRGLILWSISTGVLTWVTSVLFILSVSGVASIGFTIFFVRGGLYANAMLAQLNARARFRAMAEASMPLNTLSFAETSSSQLVDRESQPSTSYASRNQP